MELTLASALNDSTGDGGVLSPLRQWDLGLRRARQNSEGTHGGLAQKGELDQDVIHPHVERSLGSQTGYGSPE
jgi:hypothetical protein